MRQSRLGLWLLVPTVIVVIALTLFFYSTGTAHYLTPNHTIVGAIHIDSEVTWALCAGEYEIEREADGHDTIRMDGFSSAILPGTPVLPHRTYDILLPPDATNLNLKLEILSSRSRILEGTYDIKLSEPDAVLNACESVGLEPDLVNSKDVQDMRGWAEDAFFPNSPTTLISCSQMRSWKFVRVDFTPFQYNPLSKELSLTESVSIRIVFSRSEFELSQNLMTGGFMEDTAAQRFVNYAEAKYWYDGAKPEDIFQQSYDYVIVTTNAIESSSTKLSSFVAHKQSKGHSVLVVTEDDYGGLTGQAPNHKAEKIRKWLKDNYSALAIQFVLLIGNPSPYESGEGDIPMKMCHPESNNSLGAEQTPTDYFYADLTGNWDVDGDQYYGEWLHDYGYPTPVPGGVDFSPEVYVGRIPVYGSDYTTLDSILLKTIDYESEPSASIAWRRNALMPMCFNYSGYDGAQLAEQMKDDYLDATSFSSWRMYQQGSGACSLNSSFASEEELRGGTVVRDRWAGTEYGIVAWWGHGDATSAAVGYSGCWDGTLMNSTYSSSLDDTHPAFTFQCSCTNGYPENSSNLQYAILGNGGIGTVSATRTSWFNTGVGYGGFDGSTTNSGVCYEYVRGLVDESREDGAALYLAKAGMSPGSATRLANWYDFNLYGDPSVSIASATYNSVAVTVNTSGLVSSAPTTVHYVEGGATKTETTFGVWSGTVDQGSTLSIDSAVSLSPTERYNTTDTASWVVSGPAMYSVSYYHQWKPVVSVVTTGTVHTDLGNTNSATLTYYRYGSPGIYSVFDGHNFNDWIDAGSTASLTNPSSGSTSTHRWYCPGTTSWAVNDAGSLSATYWEQYKPSIFVVTTGAGHTDLDAANYAALAYYQSGSAGTFNLFDAQSFNDWVDIGSTASIPSLSSASTSTHRWYAPDSTSWTIGDASARSATYWEQYKPSISAVTTGTGHTDLDAANYAALAYYQSGSAGIFNLFDAQSFNDWVDIGSTASLPSLSSASTSAHRWYAPDSTSWTIGDASVRSATYWEQYKPTISVVTTGTGHTDLGGSTSSATLTYYRYGSPGIYSVFDGHNFNDWIDAGSMARLSNPSSGSTSTHRWYCPGTTSWAVNDAGSLSATYWEQYKPSIAIEGLDSSHPTEVVFITTGESMNASVSNGWSDWVDVGSAVRTTESIEGGWMGDWNTGDADEWTVLSAFSATVNYKRSYNGIYILVGVLLVGTMIIGAGAFFLMRGKRKKGKSESGLPDRVG